MVGSTGSVSERNAEGAVRRTEGHFVAGSGRSLFRRSWLPEEPDRQIVLVHGFGEHSGRYEEFGSWFASRGAAVHSYDQVGHGSSEGRRGHVGCFDDFLDDLGDFLELVRRENPRIPCALVGHSMGGLIVAAFALDRNPDVDRVITSGPLLALGSGAGGAKLLLARLLSRVWPTFTTDAGISTEALSRDPGVGERYTADPLVHSAVTASLGVALNEGVRRTAGGGALVRTPILMLHGGADVLCSPAGSEAFFSGVSTKESALRIYPELRHEIFNEPERHEIFQDILDWWVAGRDPGNAARGGDS
jgi:acylglycerol lipase